MASFLCLKFNLCRAIIKTQQPEVKMLTVQNPITPVDNANSYQSLTDARALAVTYGVTLPVDDTECEAALINGTMLIAQYEDKMRGNRTADTQNTPYPRIGVTIRGVEIAEDAFPLDLLVSQIIAAEAFGQGVDLFGGIDDGKNVASTTVGKISKSYFDNGKTGKGVTYSRFDVSMKPLLLVRGLGFPITPTWMS